MTSIVPFHFGEHEVRVHVDREGSPWWEAQDVCAVLGIKDTSQALTRLSPGEKRTSETRNVLIINEPGLYRLIFRSNKREAERFQTWVFSEVLPAIRKTGQYTVQPVMPVAPVVTDPVEKYPELRAIRELIIATAEARDEALLAREEARDANANAARALEAQLFFTVAEYIYINKLTSQLPASAYKACSDHLRVYCLDRRIPFRKQSVGGKQWHDEYAYHVNVYVEALPAWLMRRYAQAVL